MKYNMILMIVFFLQFDILSDEIFIDNSPFYFKKKCNMKNFEININNFEDIIKKDFLYIDKTEYVYKLINNYKKCIFTRPNLFGKSILTSTLKSVFENKKELFKDCWIYNSDYQWKQHFIIDLSLDQFSRLSVDDFVDDFCKKLYETAKKHNIFLSENLDDSALINELIEKLSNICDVVVLIDEYNFPIINNIDNLKLAKKFEIKIQELYKTIIFNTKIKFLFMIGTAKTSIPEYFFESNHLIDISESEDFASMLGYSQEELEFYFKDRIEIASEKLKISKIKLLDELKQWYGKYQFSKNESIKVYNPYSILSFFNEFILKKYWFEKELPKCLKGFDQLNTLDYLDLKDCEVKEKAFDFCGIKYLDFTNLLLQTGYLTIWFYEYEYNSYLLTYPNNETFYPLLNDFSTNILL